MDNANKKYLCLVILAIILLPHAIAAQDNKEKIPILKPGALADDSLADEKPSKRFMIIYKNKFSGDDELNLDRKGVRIKHRFKTLKAVAAEIDPSEIGKIMLDKNVESVVEDMRVHAFLKDSGPQIHAGQVHAAGVDGTGVRVCIVDTGIDDSHPALNPLVAEIDLVNNDTDATDDHGHGTHVAGIVASNDLTYKGIAFGASLMAAKVLDSSGSGWSSDVIAGIEWCVENGADIVSMSLGGDVFVGPCDSDPTAIASNNAVDQGVVVFAASGNEGYLNAIASPACGSKVIAVGAVDKSDGRTPYSNEGPELDLVAPGTSITSTFLNNGFATLSGTSMATPHAAAVAGLILEANSSLTPDQVRSVLESTAFDLGTAGFDTIYGHGRIDAFNAFSNNNNFMQQIFFDDFQGGSGKWIESVELDWNIEAPNEKQVPGKTSNLAMHADSCTSSNGCYLTFKNAINLSGYNSAKLKFWRYVDNEIDSGEFLRVQAYSGNSWSTIAQWTNNQGDDDTWHYEEIDLSNYLGNNFNLRFISKESLTSEMTEIDDVMIEAAIEQQSLCASDSGCDDGIYCNGQETCVSGSCKSSPVVDCSSLNSQCNAGICDEASDSCVLQNANEGLACNDGLFCSVGETCQSGNCAGGTSKICANSTQCATGLCDENNDACIVNPFPDGISCDDGLFCTVSDACSSGACLGSVRDCADSISCTADSCDESNNACKNTAQNSLCNDNLFCSGIEICDLNLGCTFGLPVSCNDNNACTADSCNENSDSCSFINTCQQLCWSGKNNYIRRETGSNLNLMKFCKCAQGTYGFVGYSSVSGTRTVYQYTDSGNNNNWATSPIRNFGAYRVKCSNNQWYNTNVDYFR